MAKGIFWQLKRNFSDFAFTAGWAGGKGNFRCAALNFRFLRHFLKEGMNCAYE